MTDKQKTIRKGARVRVANSRYRGAARWKNALAGVVLSVTSQGATVELDSGKIVDLGWSELDLETRPKPRETDLLIGDILPSRYQARSRFDSGGLFELAKSIAEQGLINPILVFRLEPAEAGFELIAGERRFRACWALALAETEGANLSGAIELAAAAEFWFSITEQGLGLEAAQQAIAAVVYEGDPEAFRPIAVVDNLQREDLSPVDEAAAFQALMIANEWTQTELARKLGKSKAYISQRLGLLDLVPEARELARDRAIPFDSARQVSTLPEALQGPIATKIAGNLAGDDPRTTRQVSALIGRARRFFDPEHWIPDPEIPHSAAYRNVLRLIEYHVRYLMTSDPARAPEILEALGDLAGKRPDTVASSPFFAVRILRELTGERGSSEVAQFWAPFAKLRDHGCSTCAFSQVPAPWAKPEDRVGGRARCERWNGEKASTCGNWFPAAGEPGVVIFLHWQPVKAIELGLDGDPRFEVEAKKIAAEWLEVGSLDVWAVTSAEAYRSALLLAEAYIAEQATETEVGARSKAIEPIVEFWKAQELGLEGPFSLESGFAHRCRDCRRFAPDLEADFGAPCVFAEAPLEYTETWRKGRLYSPKIAYLEGPDPGGRIPRCEGFQVRALGALGIEPVDGLEATGSGREVLLLAIERISGALNNTSDRNGAIPGPLAWVPYERKNRIRASTSALIEWLRTSELSAGELGRLITVAIYEARASDRWHGPFALVDPTSGELGHFSTAEPISVLSAEEKAQGAGDDV